MRSDFTKLTQHEFMQGSLENVSKACEQRSVGLTFALRAKRLENITRRIRAFHAIPNTQGKQTHSIQHATLPDVV